MNTINFPVRSICSFHTWYLQPRTMAAAVGARGEGRDIKALELSGRTVVHNRKNGKVSRKNILWLILVSKISERYSGCVAIAVATILAVHRSCPYRQVSLQCPTLNKNSCYQCCRTGKHFDIQGILIRYQSGLCTLL